ncbi:hypothetical protein JYU04_03445 [Dehalococcoides mccartyi]|nr:hypothetical protein [Dehalococcoides mccartyi]
MFPADAGENLDVPKPVLLVIRDNNQCQPEPHEGRQAENGNNYESVIAGVRKENIAINVRSPLHVRIKSLSR